MNKIICIKCFQKEGLKFTRQYTDSVICPFTIEPVVDARIHDLNSSPPKHCPYKFEHAVAETKRC